MYTFGPKLDYLVCILMFAYILHANDELYVCKLHSDFCKGRITELWRFKAPKVKKLQEEDRLAIFKPGLR